MTRAPLSTAHAVNAMDAADVERFATDVRYYLALDPRQLPSRYLYDPLGSALFEAICWLPWYRITRAEERLLAQHGRAVLAGVRPSAIVELGSGNGDKLHLLLESTRHDADVMRVHLVDVSASALRSAVQALDTIPAIDVTTHNTSYEEGLADALGQLRDDDRALAVFLGSNIGNYDRPGAAAFLRSLRSCLRAGDALLLGADLVKPERELLLAYDDPLGVTAAFNRNLLVRVNRELQADFDVEGFAHEAVWNAAESRVEMHLVARADHDISIEACAWQLRMARGERIWTESSYKFEPDYIVDMLQAAGFRRVHQWIDAEDGFALTLVEAA